MSKKKAFNTSKILQKVTTLFHSKGYSDTSMQDIVNISGLNRSSIYNTFGSKLDLFILCYETSEAKYRRDIQQILLSSTNALKSIRQILEISINDSYNGYLIPNYFFEVKNSEPSIQKLIINQQEYLLELFEDVIKRGQNVGSINNSKSNKQYALYILTSYLGIQSAKFINKEKNKLENIVYDIISILE
ncbi:TetR/AcrR family transcriptional regulator [uncultured Polaribacter sp.]|uniref:TetR/AcrR family transcriptional regulator n=1 Tax=uncultured Polaribacter sp. TaxID=174711 RepID=UPI0026234BEF|nr:TetR/AcrR family transcriptional regulator [uncultured Polaribacter sp.]